MTSSQEPVCAQAMHPGTHIHGITSSYVQSMLRPVIPGATRHTGIISAMITNPDSSSVLIRFPRQQNEKVVPKPNLPTEMRDGYIPFLLIRKTVKKNSADDAKSQKRHLECSLPASRGINQWNFFGKLAIWTKGKHASPSSLGNTSNRHSYACPLKTWTRMFTVELIIGVHSPPTAGCKSCVKSTQLQREGSYTQLGG